MERNKPLERFSWNMNENGTIEVFYRLSVRDNINQSVADVWRIKDHPGGDAVARKEQILLADSICNVDILYNFMKTVYQMYEREGLNDMGQTGEEAIMSYLMHFQRKAKKIIEELDA